MSFGSPCGAPPSIQWTIVATCSSVSDRSFLNFWMPTVLSICHGGICRSATRARMSRTHGRACAYVSSDIGATEFARWQESHFSWKIGATSLLNVGVVASAARASPGSVRIAPSATRPTPAVRTRPAFTRVMWCSFYPLRWGPTPTAPIRRICVPRPRA